MSFAFRSAALRSAIHRGVATVATPPPPPPVLPTLSFVFTNVAGDEGDSGTTTFLFTVSRFGAADRDASVSWTVAGAGINPASPADFIGSTSGVLVIPAGVSSGSIVVNVAGDADVETTEQFTVTLSAPVDCVIGTAVAWGTIVNDDSPYVPPPPPPPDGSTPAWVADTSRFSDYVVRLVWDANPANGWKVAPPNAGETQCPGFSIGAIVKNITNPFTNTSLTPINRIIGLIYKNVPWPKGVTVYLPAGTLYMGSSSFDSIGVKVNARFVGSARAKTWMTDGVSDGTHLDVSDALAGGYINLFGVLRFENITWRRKAGGGISKHAFECSCVYPGCFQFVGCEFRWLADAIKLHEAQTNDKKNYPLAGGYGPSNDPIWTTKGIKKDTGTSVWMYDCVVRECGGQDNGLKHGLIYALNGNTLRLDRVAVIDTTAGYLGAKAGINAIWASTCLFANRWNADGYGRRIDQSLPNNNSARYWGDTLIEPQPGAGEIVIRDSQFWARAAQSYDKIHFSANPAAGATIAINGYVVTFVAANPGSDQVLIGSSSGNTVSALATMLRASINPVAMAFDYEAYGSDLIITGKALPKAAPTVVASTSPAANAAFTAGGAWAQNSPDSFLYEHSRGKMPLAGGGKTPDYFIREWPGTNGSWAGMWWNNGTPTTPGDTVAKPGYMKTYAAADRDATMGANYTSCAFSGTSGSWPSTAKQMLTNQGWTWVDGAGVLAANRGRFVGLGASGYAITGDIFCVAEPVEIAVSLATIPATDDGQGVVHLSNGAQAWKTATAYSSGTTVASGGNLYTRRSSPSASASGATAPSGTGTNISDGAYAWDYVAPLAHVALTYHRQSAALKLTRRTGTSDTVLAQASVGDFASAKIKLFAEGGALKGKIWGLGLAEPAAWAVTATDAAPLSEGKAGLIGKNAAASYVEVDDFSLDTPYVGRVLKLAMAWGQLSDINSWNNDQCDWAPVYEDYNGAVQMPVRLKSPYNGANYWRAFLTVEDANGAQTEWQTDAWCDGRTRCVLADPIPAGMIVPKGSLVQLAPKTRTFRDQRLLNPDYHDPAHPDYYWSKLYRADGTLKEPGDPGFNDAFHVRYVDECTFTYVGPSQTIGGEAPAILKYNASAYRYYMRSGDNEGYFALPPQWSAETSAWTKPTGAGTFTHGGDTGNRFFGGTAPVGYRGYNGSDFSDPVTWMFVNSSHYCLASEFRGGLANPRTALQSYDDPSGTPANEQVPPRPRVFVQDKDTGVLTRGGARPVSTLTTLAQDGAKGDSTIRVASTAGLAVGHKIEIPLANDPWGLTQSNDPTTGRIKPYADTHVWRHVTRITAIAGDVVTLADPLPDPFPGDGLTAIAKSGAAVATTPVFPRPAHVIARFEDMTIATQVWPL